LTLTTEAVETSLYTKSQDGKRVSTEPKELNPPPSDHKITAMSVSTPPGLTFEDFFNRIVPATFLLLPSFLLILLEEAITGPVDLDYWTQSPSAIQFLILFTILLIYGEVLTAMRNIIIPVPPSLVKLFEDSDGNPSDSLFITDELSFLPRKLQEIFNKVLSGKTLKATPKLKDWLSNAVIQDASLPSKTEDPFELAALLYYETEPAFSPRTVRYQSLLDFYYNLKLSFLIGVGLSLIYFGYLLIVYDLSRLEILLLTFLTFWWLFLLYTPILYLSTVEKEYVRSLILEYCTK
jgi:hypothetical protein